MIDFIKNKWTIGIVIAIIATIIGFVSVKYFGDDNPIEESAEQVIKDQTGIDVDLSPNSPEQSGNK